MNEFCVYVGICEDKCFVSGVCTGNGKVYHHRSEASILGVDHEKVYWSTAHPVSLDVPHLTAE